MIAPADSNVELGLSAQGRLSGKSSEPVYDVLPHSTEGFWYFAARRLRKLFRRWDTDAVFVTTDREHLIAATTCWLARRGFIVRRTPAGQKLEMTFSGRFASWLRPTAFLFASEADQNAAVLPKGALRNAIAEIGIDPADYPEAVTDDSNGCGARRRRFAASRCSLRAIPSCVF
jgi:hypothetical protein